MKSFFSVVLLALTFCLPINAQTHSKKIKELDKYIQKAIDLWNPPGLAVTVVKDGNIIFTKGYGVRTIGTNNIVDENTLFGCMSTTKAFVAAGLAMLVDDGKLQWSDKVIDHLPDFRLKDSYITRELNIKDLLTHRSGLGNTDYLWSIMTISGDSAYYKLREVEKSYSLRSSFIYQNLMYHTAGKVIEAISGKAWGDFLKERIYMPLDMNDTYPLLSMVKDKENKADAHYLIDKEITKIDQMSADNVGAAGSMWASISDAGKWIQFLLNNGVVNNDTLIKPKTFKELFTPQQIIPANQFYPTRQVTKPNWMTYGLGWFQHDYRGRMVQFHTGSLAGMVAIAGMIPEDNIGIYVMGNLDHAEIRHALMYTVFDLFIDGKITRDWSEELHNLYHPESSENQTAPKPIANAPASIAESDLLGTYYSEQFGWVTISKEDDTLKFNANDTVKGSLNHWHYNTYKCFFNKRNWGDTLINFRMDENGKLSHLEFFGETFYLDN